ncbi:MAG: hypothetical protein IJ634_04930 [Bacteroidales bacterium]|nr:hypothetical protein [Bacteroidales bacterium]
MKRNIYGIKIIIVLLGVALLATACKQEKKAAPYEPENTIGLEELSEIAKDTAHYRAFIFISPYCFGCRQSMDYTVDAIAAMDTSLWRVYYLIVEDLTDEAHWQEVTDDMADIGADPSRIFHWRKPDEGYGYAEAVHLFRSTHPVAVSDGRVPFQLLVDTNNYIDVHQCRMKDNEDSVWYEPESAYAWEIDSHTDYSLESEGYSIISIGQPAPTNNIVVIEK